MVKILRQFDRWREELMPGFAPVSERRIWPKVATSGVVGLLVGIVVLGTMWYAAKPTPMPAEETADLRLAVAGAERSWFDASQTEIDPSVIKQVAVRYIDPDKGQEPLQTLALYDSPVPRKAAVPGLVRLAALGGTGAKPFYGVPTKVIAERYEVQLEAVPFMAEVTPISRTWFAQRNFGRLQLGDRPSPVWIESPQHGQVLDRPFSVKGQAYEDGYVQLRVKPKLHSRYYMKGLNEGEFAMHLGAGQSFELSVYEGGSEGFELYILFATQQKYLPSADVIDALPYDTGRVDVLGPVDFFLVPLQGPVRTDQQLKDDLEVVRKVAAHFTGPDQDAKEPPQVTWQYPCSGHVSAEAGELGLRYVLGVRPMYPVKPDANRPGRFTKSAPWGPGHNVWIQSSPWKTRNNSFEGKLVGFGVEHEKHPYWEFELWLIAIRPEAAVQLEGGQAWLASALPEGCVRVASVRVIKVAEDTQDESESNLQVTKPAESLNQVAAVFCCERMSGGGSAIK